MAKKKAAAQKAAAPVTVDDWGATAAAPSKKKKGGGGLMKMGGVVVAAVAVIMALGGGGANPLVDLDVNDEAALRKVFFGGRARRRNQLRYTPSTWFICAQARSGPSRARTAGNRCLIVSKQ